MEPIYRDTFLISDVQCDRYGRLRPSAICWFVQEIDGHDFDAIEAAYNKARETKGKPSAIVIKTIKGKDVSFMENDAGWHGKAPNDAEYAQAMTELKAKLAELEA